MLKELCNDGFLIKSSIGRGRLYHLNKVDTSNAKVDTSKNKKLKRDELENLILEICSEFHSLEEIAIKVERNFDYLKNKIMPNMIKTRKLKRLYPSTPNHPNQKYKASKKFKSIKSLSFDKSHTIK